MGENADFERCAEFLARMIEKYGNEISFPNTAMKKTKSDDENAVKARENLENGTKA